MKIAIIGFGLFGRALALNLSKKISSIHIFTSQDIKNIQPTYPEALKFYNKNTLLNPELINKIYDCIFLALPSKIVPEYVKNFTILQQNELILTSKGLFNNKLVSDYLIFYYPELKVSGIYGPCFAQDLELLKPTALSFCGNKNLFNNLQTKFFNCNLEWCNNLSMNELMGVYKNLIALLSGYCHGANFTEAIIALLINKALAEMFKVVGRNIFNYSGIPDLLMCCYSNRSRNFIEGFNLAQKHYFNIDAFKGDIIKKDKVTIEASSSLDNLSYFKDFKIISLLEKLKKNQKLNLEDLTTYYK